MDNQINQAAWDSLDQALFTSSHISAKDLAKGSTAWNNVYPTSEAETDTMEALVDDACQKADDPQEPSFAERVKDLRDIIDYSRAKQRTWKWSLIFGSIIAACIFWYFSGQDKEDADKYAKQVELVENWKKTDTTITYKQVVVPEGTNSSYQYYSVRLRSANAYKFYLLFDAKSKVESSLKYSQEYKAKADTASTAERKQSYLKNSTLSKESADKYRKEFDTAAKLSFNELKDKALAETQSRADYANKKANNKLAWMIYLIILIPLYIYTGYPRGYEISRHRRQHGLMDKLQRWGFAIATAFFGTGFLMSLLPDNIVQYRYANGRTETKSETDPTNIVVVGLKILFMALGVLIFCFVSVLIMTVEVVSGLKSKFIHK